MNRPPRACLKTEGNVLLPKPKYNFEEIENRVQAAKLLQEAGEHDDAASILKKLASELQQENGGWDVSTRFKACFLTCYVRHGCYCLAVDIRHSLPNILSLTTFGVGVLTKNLYCILKSLSNKLMRGKRQWQTINLAAAKRVRLLWHTTRAKKNQMKTTSKTFARIEEMLIIALVGSVNCVAHILGGC